MTVKGAEDLRDELNELKSVTRPKITAAIAEAREHGDLAMIMVDYLQLMRVTGAAEGRTAEISEISRNLKAIAKEFRCPVVALSQLNRALEQRPNKRPINSDLRESGAIEQDADLVFMLYRHDYYYDDEDDEDDDDEWEYEDEWDEEED